jgi:hypothetical protein
MKALKLMVIGMLICSSGVAMAQATVIIGAPPAWGPVGYPGVRYYYLPDVEAYYDIQSSQFIYYQPTGWVYASRLPSRYRHYNLYNGYKIAMTGYRGNTPYDHFSEHQRDFKKGTYHGERQKTNDNGPGNTKYKGRDHKSKENH